MSRQVVQRKKGVSPWLPVGFMLWVILMLTIFFAFYLADGQLGALSFPDAFLFVVLRMAFIALFFAPLFLAGLTVWLGYRFLIKEKLKAAFGKSSHPNTSPQETS